MKKCFCFNSYYHINQQGLPIHLHDTGQPSTQQQLTHHNLRISFLNLITMFFYRRIILIKYF